MNTGGRSLPWQPGVLAHPAANCVTANLATNFQQNCISTKCTLYCQAEKNHQCAQRRGVPFDSQTWPFIRWKLQLRNIWPFLFFHRLGSGVQLQVAAVSAAEGKVFPAPS